MKRIYYLVFFLIAGVTSILLNTNNTYADTLATASLDLNYKNDNQGYQWQNNIYFGRQYGVSIAYGSARIYQFNTPQITTGGTSASVHFETNIVASTDDIQYVFGYFVNLQQQQVRGCSWQGQPLTMSSSSLSTAITEWTEVINSVTYYNVTLTLYGDVALSGFPNNSQGVLTCSVGSLDYAFYDNPTDNPDLLYFEQNPMRIYWSSNINDALLQTQINQNTTIINNQNEIKDWLTDDTPPNVDTSALSGASGWLPPGPVDSVLTLPITLAQNVVNIFTGQNTCRPIVLPFDFLGAGTSLSIPCLSTYLSDAGANIIWNTVGLVISAFMYYYTLRWLYKFIDDTLTLRENETTMWGGL